MQGARRWLWLMARRCSWNSRRAAVVGHGFRRSAAAKTWCKLTFGDDITRPWKCCTIVPTMALVLLTATLPSFHCNVCITVSSGRGGGLVIGAESISNSNCTQFSGFAWHPEDLLRPTRSDYGNQLAARLGACWYTALQPCQQVQAAGCVTAPPKKNNTINPCVRTQLMREMTETVIR